MAFADLVNDIDAMLMSSLNDGKGDYFDSAGIPVAQGIELIIDRNLQQAGPDGVFLSNAVGITCRNVEVGGVNRGGLFVIGGDRFVVETIIADDGHMLTAACMESP